MTVALVGRWCLSLMRGQFFHSSILNTRPHPQEIRAGWAFHFLIGGGGVALLYPFFFVATGLSYPASHLLGGVLFGLATSLLPWFILLPCFGWGVSGRRGPTGSNALLASMLSHVPYGLGVGVLVGHPEYYPRFGFLPGAGFGIHCAYDVPEEAFMALELRPGYLKDASGVVKYHEAFDHV